VLGILTKYSKIDRGFVLHGLFTDTVRSLHCVAHSVRKTKEYWIKMDRQKSVTIGIIHHMLQDLNRTTKNFMFVVPTIITLLIK
jgi:hypothetical protein